MFRDYVWKTGVRINYYESCRLMNIIHCFSVVYGKLVMFKAGNRKTPGYPSYLMVQQKNRRQTQKNKKSAGIGQGGDKHAGTHRGIALQFGHNQRDQHAH